MHGGNYNYCNISQLFFAYNVCYKFFWKFVSELYSYTEEPEFIHNQVAFEEALGEQCKANLQICFEKTITL